MVTVDVTLCQTSIDLGRKGENMARQIRWDVSAWQTEYGSGTVALLVKRPKESNIYPAVIETEGSVVKWTVMLPDTGIEGAGECELVYLVDDVVVKSKIYATRILRGLDEDGPVPDPYESWVTEILQDGALIREFLQQIEGGNPGQVMTQTEIGPQWRDPQGGGGGTWSELDGKPFERIGETLAVRDGVLDVNIHEVHNDAGGLTTIIG